MGILGAPFGLALMLAPMLLLTLASVGHLPASVNRWLYSLIPLFWLGLLAVAASVLARWAKRGRERGPDAAGRKLLWIGAGTTAVLFLLPLAAMLLAPGRMRPPAAADGPATDSGQFEGVITNGFHFDFTLPAGQVVVFEMVTQRGRDLLPLAKLSAHALAPADREAMGTLRLERELAWDMPGLQPRWRFEPRYGGGVRSVHELELSSTLATAMGLSSLGLVLEPEREVIQWLHQGNERQTPLGLRIRTEAHGRTDEEVNRGAVFQLGTNWQTTVASPR